MSFFVVIEHHKCDTNTLKTDKRFNFTATILRELAKVDIFAGQNN